jgi:hypothetical protein
VDLLADFDEGTVFRSFLGMKFILRARTLQHSFRRFFGPTRVCFGRSYTEAGVLNGAGTPYRTP